MFIIQGLFSSVDPLKRVLLKSIDLWTKVCVHVSLFLMRGEDER